VSRLRAAMLATRALSTGYTCSIVRDDLWLPTRVTLYTGIPVSSGSTLDDTTPQRDVVFVLVRAEFPCEHVGQLQSPLTLSSEERSDEATSRYAM